MPSILPYIERLQAQSKWRFILGRFLRLSFLSGLRRTNKRHIEHKNDRRRRRRRRRQHSCDIRITTTTTLFTFVFDCSGEIISPSTFLIIRSHVRRELFLVSRRIFVGTLYLAIFGAGAIFFSASGLSYFWQINKPVDGKFQTGKRRK